MQDAQRLQNLFAARILNKKDALELHQLAQKSPKEIAAATPELFKKLRTEADKEIHERLKRNFRTAAPDVLKVVNEFDLSRHAGRDIKSLLAEVFDKANLTDDEKNGALVKLNELHGSGALIDPLADEVPLQKLSLLQGELAAANTHVLADIAGLPEKTVDTLIEKDIRVDLLNDDLLNSLVKSATLSDKQAKDLGLTHDLYHFLDQNTAFTRTVKEGKFKQLGENQVATMQDLVSLSAEDWEQAIKDAGVQLPPKMTAKQYAGSLVNGVSSLFPTDSFFDQLKPLPKEQLIELLNLPQRDKAVSKLVNDFPGLDLDGVLNNSKLTVPQKVDQITERTGWVMSVREKNPDSPFLALDYSPDSNDVKALKFDGLTADAKEKVLSTLKAYQRAFAITTDVAHAGTLLSAGYSSAASIVRDGPDTFTTNTGLAANDSARYFSTAAATVGATSTLLTTALDLFHGGFNWLNVNNTSPAIEDYLKSLNGFADLFGQQGGCNCAHCQSILSPAAYFVDLMCFIEEHVISKHFAGARAAHVLNLKTRRPDLWKLELNCENTTTETPTLDLINEILENYIAGLLGLNNFADRVAVERLVYEQTLSRSLAHVANETIYSFRHPFNLPLQRLDTYLTHFERTRATVARTIGASPAAIAIAHLKLAKLEYDLITQPNADLVYLSKLYDGLQLQVIHATGRLQAFDASLLLKATGLTRSQLGAATESRFVTNKGAEPIRIQPEKTDANSVQNDIERIHDLTPAALDRLHRFTRLWRQLRWKQSGEKEDRHWSIPEFDLVLLHFGQAGLAGDIAANTLEHLATVLSIQERFAISVEELCTLWSNIPTTPVSPEEPPLFDRLFNLPSFVKLDQVFPKDGTKFIHPSFRLAAPPPVDTALLRLLAGLRLSDEQLSVHISNLSGPLGINLASANEDDRGFNLTRANLSVLYRHARLAEWLRLPVSDLYQLISLSPAIPQGHIGTLNQLVTLLDLYDWWKTTDYSLDDLGFITGGRVSKPDTYPDKQQIATQLVEEIQNERPLVFAGTVFTEIAGVTEQESRAVISANLASIEELPDGSGFRLKANFNPAAALVIPPGAVITQVEAREVLGSYQASNVIPKYLTGKLGVSDARLAELLQMTGTDLSAEALVLSIQGGPANALRDLIGTLLPLSILFKHDVFDANALPFIRTNAGVFAIADFNAINLASIRKLSVYKFFADSSQAVKFNLDAPQAVAAEIQDLLQTFNPGAGFDVNDVDPQVAMAKLAKFARVLRAEPGLAATIHAHISPPATAPEALLKMFECVQLARYLGVSGETLKLMVSDDYAQLAQASDAILSAFRAKYPDEKDWQSKIEPYEDIIRSRKRAGLVDYLIHNTAEFDTTNDLFHHLLIDVQLEGCARTSRVVAAISSAQLYVHRCVMNLEQDSRAPGDPNKVHVQPEDIPRDEWNWRKNYRVWEANRKVFLFPENYIEPELRDDKTPLFEELESTLLQQDINAQTVLDAYGRYMSGFEELAKLKIAGAYHHVGGGKDVLHLFGVTPLDPPTFYYRTVENTYEAERPARPSEGQGRVAPGIVWSPWRKIDVQIPVRKVAPVINRGRLYLFWIEITTIPKNSQLTAQGSRFVAYKHTVVLKYTSLRLDGTWTTPQTISRASFPFGVVDDSIGDAVDANGNIIHNRPLYDRDRAHLEPQDGYTLRGFQWEAYPSTFAGDVYLTAQNFIFTAKVDFYPRATDTRLPEDTGNLPPDMFLAKIGSAKVDAADGRRKFYHGEKIRESNFLPLAFGWQDPVWNYYAEDSILLEQSRIAKVVDSIRESTGINLNFSALQNGLYIGNGLVALNLDDELAVINGFGGEYLIDSKGDLLLLQGSVRNGADYLLKRLGTTLGETLSRRLFTDGVDGLLDTQSQMALREAGLPIQILEHIEDASAALKDPAGKYKLSFTGPYGAYFREIFFHIPFLIANHLNSTQKFANSQHWYHYIFDPTATEVIPPGLNAADLAQAERDRNWRYLEFRNVSLPSLRNILSGSDRESAAAIETYKKDPFNPHAIARLRLTAYQKSIVTKYIDNLLDWGDSLFAEFTRESINEATLLYVMAQDILGERPVELGDCGEGQVNPRDYETIAPLVKNGSEFLVELETLHWSRHAQITSANRTSQPAFVMPSAPGAPADLLGPAPTAGPQEQFDADGWRSTFTSSWTSTTSRFINEISHRSPLIRDFERAGGFSWSLARQVSPVFCVPSNKDLLDYWDRVEKRLFNIRHCLDITGARRELALFAPEIDPRLLVRAKAAGLSLEDVLNSISGNLPPYRFVYLLEKARSYAGTLQNFGGALLSALEKKAVEELTRLRTVHEQNLLKLTTQIRQWEIDTITQEILALERRKDSIDYRKGYYQGLVDGDLTPWERTQQVSHHASSISTLLADALSGTAGVLYLLPQLGSPFAMKYGGQELGHSAEEWAQVFRDTARVAQIVAGSAGLEAGFQRRADEWKHQVQLATRELKEVEKQLAVAALRKQIAENGLENHKAAVAQQEEVFDFYSEKFSSLGLYTFLSTTLQRLYRESYNSAYAIAHLAEQAYKFERGDDGTALIEAGYWDASKAGLLAGEQLLLALQNLERRFLETNYRNFEVTQSFSLAQVDPAALIQLRENGACTFAIPEFCFDVCYPGQYRRIIKAARLTIPCVAGPYTNVAATLSLSGSRVRTEPRLAAPLTVIPPQRSVSIATSTGQNDAGVFEFSFRDERYMPFEGAGAISTWELSLPRAFPQFDYNTISDVVLHISYTADFDSTFRVDVERQDAAVVGTLMNFLTTQPLRRALSFRQDFSGAFQQLLHSPINTPVKIQLSQKYFPFFLAQQRLQLHQARLVLKTKAGVTGDDLQIDINGVRTARFTEDVALAGLKSADIAPAFAVGMIRDHNVMITTAGDLAPAAPRPGDQSAIDSDKLTDIVLYLEYRVQHP